MLTATVTVCAGSTSPTQIDIDGSRVFPESLTSAVDGSIYIGGQSTGAVYRARPGSGQANLWIRPGTHGLISVFGVLADSASKTLWVCSVDRTTETQDGTSLMAFDLTTGMFKANYSFPGGGICNDAVVMPDGGLYVTDTANARILWLPRNGKRLVEAANDPLLKGVDGIVRTRDGRLFVNTYGTGMLLRLDPVEGVISQTVTRIEPDRPLVQPDGMRLAPDGTIVMAEGGGRVDRVTVTGDRAHIEVLHEGYQVPSAVTVVGQMIWVLETKANYLRDPGLQAQDPGNFHAYAVPLTK
jgi:outer membrane protein assembly factor BamB